MEAKHTEGPWECIGFEFINDEEEKENFGAHAFKAIIRRENKSTKVSVFDANVISAAPELLAALETLLAEWEKKERADGREWGKREVVMARTAIAKAKRKSNV